MESFGNFNSIDSLEDNIDPLAVDPMDVLEDDKLIFDDEDIGLVDEDIDIGEVGEEDDDEDAIIEDSYDDYDDF